MSGEERNEKVRPFELYRQPAYDAVYRVIRECSPRSTDDYGVAAENARVWRAVEAALDAMGAPTGQRGNLNPPFDGFVQGSFTPTGQPYFPMYRMERLPGSSLVRVQVERRLPWWRRLFDRRKWEDLTP